MCLCVCDRKSKSDYTKGKKGVKNFDDEFLIVYTEKKGSLEGYSEIYLSKRKLRRYSTGHIK